MAESMYPVSRRDLLDSCIRLPWQWATRGTNLQIRMIMYPSLRHSNHLVGRRAKGPSQATEITENPVGSAVR